MAQMTVTTLLDDVRPRISGKVNLKAFITLDSSAGPMKEQIKDFVGTYPMTPYASTESMVCTLPSGEHPGCVSLDDKNLKVNTPVFSFYSRADKLVSLHNFTRINEQEIITVLQSAEV